MALLLSSVNLHVEAPFRPTGTPAPIAIGTQPAAPVQTDNSQYPRRREGIGYQYTNPERLQGYRPLGRWANLAPARCVMCARGHFAPYSVRIAS